MNRIFIDMDGVIVDFDAYKAANGLTSDEVKRRPGAYLEMSAIPGAIKALRSLIGMGFEVWIATKPPTGIPYAYADKVAWVMRELPELQRRIIITHDKGLLGDAGDFLCDDRPHKANCESFAGTLLRFVDGYHWPQALEFFRAVKRTAKAAHASPDASPNDLSGVFSPMNACCFRDQCRALAAAHAQPALPPQSQEITSSEPRWCWSADGEYFNSGAFDTEDDAIRDALAAGNDAFEVGQIQPIAISELIDADDVVDVLANRASDLAGEAADDWPTFSPEDRAVLERMLHAFIQQRSPVTFWTVSGATGYERPTAEALLAERTEGGGS